MVSWMLEDMLEQLGCVVVGPASRVKQALAIIDTQAIDAAVLDVNLNGEKSYPVADALHARGVPFFFSTGYGPKGIAQAYRQHPYLQKPLERTSLRDVLGTLLSAGERKAPKQRCPDVWDANRLRIASDAAGIALWSWNVDTDAISMDERSHALWGVPVGSVTFTDLSAHIHPEDLDRVKATFASTRKVPDVYEVEFRILRGKDVRWVSARGHGDDQGLVGQMMFGVFLDVTERKTAEEAREMVAGEMVHRVKNLFSIASALAMISERSTTTSKEMSRDLRLRLSALNRAHDLVRPEANVAKGATLLGDLLATLLAPYSGDDASGHRVRISVPELCVGDASATAMALIVHELATNSIKYGSLSTAIGRLDVTCVVDDQEVVLVWREQDGPEVIPPKGNGGYGSRLIAGTVTGQFAGSIDFEWLPEGVVVVLRTSIARLRL